MLRQCFKRKAFARTAFECFDAALKHERLCDVLIASAEGAARALDATPKTIVRSSDLNIEGASWERVLHIVKALGGDRYITGHGAANYLDHAAFESQGVAVDYMDYQVRPWPQGESAFTPYVTALDLIASAGEDARDHLQPATCNWRDFLTRKGLLP